MRGVALAVAVAAGLVAPAAVAKPDDHKPPKPKPPELELLTESQEKALAQRRIRIGVESKDGQRVTVHAELVVEGIPDDFHFAFGPTRKRLRDEEAKVSFQLSRRQREVLAFGEQACMRADVNAQGKVGKRVTTIHEQLDKPADC